MEVQDCMKITNHFGGINRIYPNLIKENRRMLTCNRFDLQTLGSQPIMFKNLPDHGLDCCSRGEEREENEKNEKTIELFVKRGKIVGLILLSRKNSI